MCDWCHAVEERIIDSDVEVPATPDTGSGKPPPIKSD
jgi:hypothetical protein